MGEVQPSDLIGIGLPNGRAGAHILRFLGELTSSGDAPRDADHAYLGQRLAARHDPGVKTLSLRFDRPFTWAAFTAAMEMLIGLRGKDLLRVKGLVNVEGRPMVAQGVGHVFHDPVALDRWPSADTDSRIVFIARRIETSTLRAVFQAAGELRDGD